MTAIIKRQLAKLLAPYFEGMTADDFSLSFFRGKGGVKDLRLSRSLLASLLPPWLIVDEARCELVRIKVPWTKLKRSPVCVIITTINASVRLDPDAKPNEPATPGKTPTATKAPTTPEPPSPTKAPGGKDDAGADKFGIGGKYNFIDIIVDGITVQIGHINVTLTTPDVKASIGLHGFRFFSPAADWSEPSSLKDTRIKNKTLNTITLFKQIELQSLDIELAQRNPKQGYDPFYFQLQHPILRLMTTKPINDSAAIVDVHAFVLLGRLQLVLSQGQLSTLQLSAAQIVTLLQNVLPQFAAAAGEDDDEEDYEDEDAEDDDVPAPAAALMTSARRAGFFRFGRKRLTPEEKAERARAKIRKNEERREKKAAAAAAAGKPPPRRKKQRGGFVPRSSYLELLPQVVSSLHVHVELILLQLSRAGGSAAQQAALKTAGLGNLLMATTINDVIVHRFFSHAPGAPLPHRGDTDAVWAQHDVWLPRLRSWLPVNALPVDPAYADLRQHTTVVYVRRLLMVADGAGATLSEDATPATGSVADRRRASRANTIKAVFSNRQRAVLMQPASADQPPLLTLVLTELHRLPRRPTSSSLPPPPPTPPQSVYVHVTPLLVGADPHALFQIAKFFTDSLEPSLGRVLATTVAGASKAKLPPKTSGTSSAPATPPDPIPPPPPYLLVKIEAATVQLPRIGVKGDALGFEAAVHNCVISNAPWSNSQCADSNLMDGLYDGWLSTHSSAFPAQPSPDAAPLPPASNLLRSLQANSPALPASSTGSSSDETSPSPPPPLFVAVQSITCRTVPANSSSPAKPPLLAPLSVALLVLSPPSSPTLSTEPGHVIVKVTSPVVASIDRDTLVYLLRLGDTVGSLPVHELVASIKEFAPPPAKDNSSAAMAPLVFVHVPHVNASIVDAQACSLLTAALHGVQVAVAPPKKDSGATHIRVAVDGLALEQPSMQAALDVVDAPLTSGESADEPQVRVLVEVLAVPPNLKAAHYDAYQARKLQLRSLLVYEEEQRQASGRGSRIASAIKSAPPATKMPAAPNRLSEGFKLDVALEALAEEAPTRAKMAENAARVTNSSSRDDLSDSTTSEEVTEVEASMGDEDFATADVKPAWLYAETWSAQDQAQPQQQQQQQQQQAKPQAVAKVEARRLLEDVNAFLRHSGQRGLLETTLKPYVPPPPPRYISGQPLEYEALPELPQPRIRLMVSNVALDLDTLPLTQLGEVFDFLDRLPNGDDPHVLPPSNVMPPIELDVRGLRLRVMDGAVLNRLPLLRPLDRSLMFADASTLICVPALHVRISSKREIELVPAEGGAGGGGAGAVVVPADAASEIEQLRQQLAAARAEVVEAHRLLNDSYRALQASAEALTRAEAQTVALMDARNSTQT